MLDETRGHSRADIPVGRRRERREINTAWTLSDAAGENKTGEGVKDQQGSDIAILNRVVRRGLIGG